MGIGTTCFPELTSRVFIVNAPWAAVKGFNLVAPLLPPATRDKIFMKGSKDFLPELLQLVDADQLPSWLGGTGSDLGCVVTLQFCRMYGAQRSNYQFCRGKDALTLGSGIARAESVPEGFGTSLPVRCSSHT